MRWAQQQRLDFIRALLREPGEVRRADLMTAFDISPAQASADINEFTRRWPLAMLYDGSAKVYVLNRHPGERLAELSVQLSAAQAALETLR